MRGAIAEFEKAKIIDRSMRGKKKKAQQGKIIQDFKLYGYNYDETTFNYKINEEQAAVIRKIFNLSANGMSVEAIQR